MIKNRSYEYVQDQGHGHLGHMTPCWTCLVIADGRLLERKIIR